MKTLIAVVMLAVAMSAQQKKQASECNEATDLLTASSDGSIYKCRGGEWVKDEMATKEAEEASIKRAQEKRALAEAIRTRPLTDEELQKAIDRGYRLFIQDGWSFREDEKQREFMDAMLFQHKIRLIKSDTEKIKAMQDEIDALKKRIAELEGHK